MYFNLSPEYFQFISWIHVSKVSQKHEQNLYTEPLSLFFIFGSLSQPSQILSRLAHSFPILLARTMRGTLLGFVYQCSYPQDKVPTAGNSPRPVTSLDLSPLQNQSAFLYFPDPYLLPRHCSCYLWDDGLLRNQFSILKVEFLLALSEKLANVF